jgi:hypothetical protein
MIISLAKVKSLLQISVADTSKDSLISELIPIVQDVVLKFTENSFEILTDLVYRLSNTISFEAGSPPKIFDPQNQLIAIGFTSGLDIKVKGSKFNDNYYTIDSLTDGVLNLSSSDTLINEPANNLFTILITVVQFPRGIELPVSKLIGFHLDKKKTSNVASESLGDHSISYQSAGSYPKHIIEDLVQYRLLKAMGSNNTRQYNINTKRYD